jgi:hypothetical protein
MMDCCLFINFLWAYKNSVFDTVENMKVAVLPRVHEKSGTVISCIVNTMLNKSVYHKNTCIPRHGNLR